MPKNQQAVTLIELLVVLVVFIITVGGVVVWGKKVVRTPTPTPVVPLTPAIKISPSPTPQTKMPWDDSVCGNGICERCESRNECCNYPCATDPISGNQMCPPPTCLGWCPQDCTNITLSPTPITSCQTNADCPPSVGVCIPGNCPGWVCQDKRCVYIEDMKAVPPAGTSSSVSWEEAKRLILSGQVKEIYQAHSLLVILVLKDGSRKTTTEPKIDIVFDVVRQCGQLCSDIISATE